MKEYYNDLGGFAESPDVLEEGTEEAQEAFNFCLASDYIDAIYAEDFESLGCVDHDLLDNVFMWYEIGGGTLSLEEKHNIRTGGVVTFEGRTLVEAVLEDRNDWLASTFIYNGNHDPRLYALCVTEDQWKGLLNSDSDMNRDDYLKFLRDIFDLVEENYGNSSGEGKLKMLSCIKTNLLSIKYNKEIGPLKLDDVGSYQFVKDMRRN